jgi:serine/threonine-protein kinase
METIMMHVQRAPEPPSGRTARPIPPELEGIILDCLAKDPAARPQTADDLGGRLAAVPLADEWTPRRAGEWWSGYLPTALTSDLPREHG